MGADEQAQIWNYENSYFSNRSTNNRKLRITADGQLQATGAADVRLTLGSGGTAGTNDSVHMRADGASLILWLLPVETPYLKQMEQRHFA